MAFSYFEKTLEIQQQVLSIDYLSLITTYRKMSELSLSLNNYDQAKEYGEQACNIAREALGPTHESVKQIEEYLHSFQKDF